jgi:hypothetical protein
MPKDRIMRHGMAQGSSLVAIERRLHADIPYLAIKAASSV